MLTRTDDRHHQPLLSLDLTAIDWGIVGGESGHRARPMNPVWVRVIRDRCHDSGIAFHFKKWGGWGPASGQRCSDFEQFGTDPAATVRKVGKDTAGRLRDGRAWDELPSPNGGRVSA
jgi:protein gp37